MSYFLSSSGKGGNITNGNTEAYLKSVRCVNLLPNETLKTNNEGKIITAAIAIGDVVGLQDELDAKLGVPMSIDLDMNDNKVTNVLELNFDAVSLTEAKFNTDDIYAGDINLSAVNNLYANSLLSGAVISQGLGNTFNVSTGYYRVNGFEYTSPALVNQPLANLATANKTYISFNGVYTQATVKPGLASRNSTLVYVGYIFHPNSAISYISQEPDTEITQLTK